jgi:FKBP-type peptidyl-prolyl cis-trans isomerase
MKFNNNFLFVAGLTAATYIGLGAADFANTANAEESKVSTVSLESEKAKLGYSFGARIGQDLLRGGMLEEIDVDAFVAAIKDASSGGEPRMTAEEMQQAQQSFQLKKQQEYAAITAENKTKSDAHLEKNKAKKGVQVTESGLQYEVEREGKGKKPGAQDTVKVHYTGKLIDGTVFDSSYERDQPTDFPVSNVIPGFSEGLQLMSEGAKYTFTIPSSLAYGEQAPPTIGPNQVLIFEVELLEVAE